MGIIVGRQIAFVTLRILPFALLIMISLNCAAPRTAQNLNLNWLPDKTGNLIITNETGTDIDVYLHDNYVRSIGKGTMDYAVDIPVLNVHGEICSIKIFSRTSGVQIAVFELVLYPSSMPEKRLPLFVRTEMELQ
jgi:hypothetical protein